MAQITGVRRLQTAGLMLGAMAALATVPQRAKAEAATGLSATFDNTIVSTYADGGAAKLWIDRDGRYRGVSRTGQPSSGAWFVKGARLCFRQSRPIPAPFAYCTPLQTGGVGTVWTQKSVFGEPLSVALVSGR